MDFRGKHVLDLGVGYGDLAMRAAAAGAYVRGLDRDIEPFCSRITEANSPAVSIGCDLNKLAGLGWDEMLTSPVIFCFSVLPYVDDPYQLLFWIQAHCETAFIECQYAGDGPGFGFVRDDDDMRDWLSKFRWKRVEAIGRTYVQIRDLYRTVWMCVNE